MTKKAVSIARRPYTKTALTSQTLLVKLKAQGLIVEDDVLALQYITYVGHFRLKGYWYQLQDPATGNFRPGTTFARIRYRYECDREIRAIIMESVERLEVAIRTVICNLLSLKYSAHWYLNTALFAPKRKSGIGQMLSKIENGFEQAASRLFVTAYYENYDDPYLPPSWAMSECVTLGTWSRIFAMLRDPADRKIISSKFGITQVEVFESWLHTLTVLRNMAAHHARFLDVKTGVSPTNLKLKAIKFSDNSTVFASLTVIHILLEAIGFSEEFKMRLERMEDKYGIEHFQLMGFPEKWKTDSKGW